MTEFQGFSPETIDFLWGIRFNNNREWFEPHKKQYQQSLYEPMKALARELYPGLEDLPELECKVSRIYRDARLHPPTPYKESLWISFRASDRSWGEQPVFYFEITPDEYSFGFLMWFPKTWQMEQFRKQLAEDPGEFLAIVKDIEENTDLRLEGEQFKRPKPCPDESLERFFKLKNFGVTVCRGIDERLFSPELANEILECYQALKPLMRWTRKVML